MSADEQTLQAVSEETFHCSECGSSEFVDRDGWRWCTACGIGRRILEPQHNAPGVGLNTYVAPVNDLSFGRDLGNPAVDSKFDRKALLSMLKKQNLAADVGNFLKLLFEASIITERQFIVFERRLKASNYFDVVIRNITLKNECMKAQETTISERMKRYASWMSKKYGFQNHHTFSNMLGRAITLVAAVLSYVNDGSHSKDFATATFLLNVMKFAGDETAYEMMQTEWGKPVDGQVVVPESKKRFIQKAKKLLELDKLLH